MRISTIHVSSVMLVAKIAANKSFSQVLYDQFVISHTHKLTTREAGFALQPIILFVVKMFCFFFCLFLDASFVNSPYFFSNKKLVSHNFRLIYFTFISVFLLRHADMLDFQNLT